jgi:hypothetical protein
LKQIGLFEEELERLDDAVGSGLGPRQIFKIRFEPKETYGPNIERALHSALHTFEEAEKRWRTLIECGASDADLMAAIAREFGSSGGSTRHGGYKHKGGKNPEFSWPHYSGRSNLTLLKGKRLLTMVRSILGIGPSRTAIYPLYSHSL